MRVRRRPNGSRTISSEPGTASPHRLPTSGPRSSSAVEEPAAGARRTLRSTRDARRGRASRLRGGGSPSISTSPRHPRMSTGSRRSGNDADSRDGVGSALADVADPPWAAHRRIHRLRVLHGRCRWRARDVGKAPCPGERPAFFDLRCTSAWECERKGVDVLPVNPCDPRGRPADIRGSGSSVRISGSASPMRWRSALLSLCCSSSSRSR